MARGNTDSTPTAAQRLGATLQRWRASLDLHQKYLSLDDERYWHVQPWPRHERPAGWIVQLARQKLAELERMLAAQESRNAEVLAAALEHMQFLANLVGLKSAERHIPLAEVHHERGEALGIVTRPNNKQPMVPDPTREMPKLRAARRQPTAPPPNRASVHTSNTLQSPAAPSVRELQVMQDAARMLQWGRSWHELGELIARMAERPSLSETRRILRSHRARIELMSQGERRKSSTQNPK